MFNKFNFQKRLRLCLCLRFSSTETLQAGPAGIFEWYSRPSLPHSFTFNVSENLAVSSRIIAYADSSEGVKNVCVFQK